MASPPQVPWYKSQGFWLIVLLLIGLRLGYKAWRRAQHPSHETTLEQLESRKQQLQKRLQTTDNSRSAPVIVADSTRLADTSTAVE